MTVAVHFRWVFKIRRQSRSKNDGGQGFFPSTLCFSFLHCLSIALLLCSRVYSTAVCHFLPANMMALVERRLLRAIRGSFPMHLPRVWLIRLVQRSTIRPGHANWFCFCILISSRDVLFIHNHFVTADFYWQLLLSIWRLHLCIPKYCRSVNQYW